MTNQIIKPCVCSVVLTIIKHMYKMYAECVYIMLSKFSINLKFLAHTLQNQLFTQAITTLTVL